MELQTLQAIKRERNPLYALTLNYKRVMKGIVGALSTRNIRRFLLVPPLDINDWRQKNRGKTKTYAAWVAYQAWVKHNQEQEKINVGS